MASIGEKIKEARIQRGMTQSELGQDLVTPSMISQIESDKAKPSYPVLSAIADRLGLPVDYFLTDLADQYASLALTQLTRAYLLLGQEGQALKEIENALPPESPGLAYEEHRLVLAETLRHHRSFEEATYIIEGLREVALRKQDKALLFMVCLQSGYIEYDTFNYEGAILEWETCIRIGETLEAPGSLPTATFRSMLSEVSLNLYHIHIQRDDTAKAKEAIQRAMQWTRPTKTLRTIADSFIQDGHQWLGCGESSRAQDSFRHAFLLAEAAQFMERSIEIETEYHRYFGGQPVDPWRIAAVSSTSIVPQSFLECELRSISQLIDESQLEVAYRRIEACREMLAAYVGYDPKLESLLQAYPPRLTFLEARVRAEQDEVAAAVALGDQALAAFSDALSTESVSTLQKWIDMAGHLVTWKVEAEQFDAAIRLSMDMQGAILRLQQRKLTEKQRLSSPLNARI